MSRPPDLEARVARLETQVHDLQERVRQGQQVDDGFVEMRGKFDATVAGLQQITDMLNTLIPQDL